VETMRKRLASVLVALLLMCPLQGTAFGDDSEYNRTSLAGLRGVAVVVETTEKEFEQAGVAVATLTTDVELKLRQSGIRVLAGSERLDAPGFPYLYVNLNLLRSSSGAVSYSLRVELMQRIRLVRDAKIELSASTWSVSSVGTVGLANLSAVRGPVRDAVDRFANEYLAANPKRKRWSR
jgi:hypothetical protein